MSYTHRGDFKHLSQAGKDAVWNTLGLLPVLQPDATGDAQSTTTSAIANGKIEIKDNFANLDELSRDTANSLNKLDEIFDKKKVEERQELSQLFAKEAFAQLHYWNPTSPEGKAAKAIAHGIVAETSARIAGNKAGSGFYAGATNEALIGEIQKIAKDNPAVAQWVSASIGAAVNAGIGNSAVTGAAVAQYGTKWNELVQNTPDSYEGKGIELDVNVTDIWDANKEEIQAKIMRKVTEKTISELAKQGIKDSIQTVKVYINVYQGVRFLGRVSVYVTIADGIYNVGAFKYEYRPTNQKEFEEWLEYNNMD